MRTYKLTLEYDGTRYHGWQEQANAKSIAGEIRRAMTEITGGIVDLGGSGRTDAGVHALAQTAHLRLADPVDPERLRRAVNEELPSDIHILALAAEEDRFHARHAAVSRSYLYQISGRRTAFGKRFVWWVRRPLDPGKMAAVAKRIEGRHDFALFCERPSEQTSTVVVVEQVEVAAAGALVLVRLVASHFLWKMVRRLVGTLVKIGAGELTEGDLVGLMEGRPVPAGKGAPAEWTAPPSGLFLERVTYPGDPPLPALSAVFPVNPEPAGFPGRAPRKAAARPPRRTGRAPRSGKREPAPRRGRER